MSLQTKDSFCRAQIESIITIIPKEKMKILYLIGNGFDLHVGLKTAYPAFLKYYLAQPLPDAIDEVGQRFIMRLKNDIQNNIQLWSDLEFRYGKHMSQIGGMGKAVYTLQEELDIINDDIRENLSAYIAEQDRRSFFAENARKTFLDDVVKPYSHLRDFEITEINIHRSNSWRTTTDVVDFITYNYTRTLEHLIGKTPVITNGFEVHEPVHVHGYYDQRMIFGVNDASQIENDELKKLTYATDTLVKSDNNHSYGVSHTNNCDSLISNAQLICCYGLSFGETDRLWWRKVCEELMRRGDLIIILFSYEPNLPNFANNGHKLQNKMRQKRDEFLTKGGISDPEKRNLEQRIYVSINDIIFNLMVDDRTPMEQLIGKSAPGTVERFVENLEAMRK